MSAAAATSGSAGDGPTVLLVEDEPDVRMVLSILLRRAGFGVLQARDGQEAADVLGANRGAVDVVLMDVMMPVLTGPEALPLLRALVPDLPVVFHSGYDQGEVAAHLSDTPPYTSFVPKPAEKQTLVDELTRAQGRRGAP